MIRQAQSSDVLDIVKLEEEVFNSSLGFEILNNIISISNFNFGPNVLLLEDAGTILGYISLNFDGEVVEVLNFLVNPDFQGKGYGYFFLDNVIKLYEKNAKSFYLEVRKSNFKAINLYEKLGFIKINERSNYYSNGEDALVLQKIL